jgi:hypothetical protein
VSFSNYPSFGISFSKCHNHFITYPTYSKYFKDEIFFEDEFMKREKEGKPK